MNATMEIIVGVGGGGLRMVARIEDGCKGSCGCLLRCGTVARMEDGCEDVEVRMKFGC
jgi:hypothetical protein